MGNMQGGAHKMPLIGQWFENPDEQAKLKRMVQANQQIQAYRPQMADARLRAMQQQMGAYAPMNRALGQMYGPGAQLDMAGMTQQPMSPYMQQLGGMDPWDPSLGRYEQQRGALGAFLGGPLGAFAGQAHGRKMDKKRGQAR